MRFHEVSVGQRFDFEGETYRKKSQVTATHEVSGRQKFIRRSAPVQPVGAEASAIPQPKACIDVDIVRKALDAFHERCLECLADLAREASEASIADAIEKLQGARAEFESVLPSPIRAGATGRG